MNLIIDLIFLAIIIITAYISSKYGFMRTLIELVGFIFIIIIADKVSMPIANYVYKSTVETKIVDYADDVKNNSTASADEFIDKLPDIITDNGLLGISKDNIKEKYNSYVSAGTREAVLKVNDNLIKPMMVKVLSLFVSLLVFVILNFIVVFLAKFLNGIVKHSFAKGLNEKLGFIFGIPKGVLIAFVVAVAIIALTSIRQKGIWIFSYDIINKSYAISFVKKFMPKFNLFNIFNSSSTVRSLLF